MRVIPDAELQCSIERAKVTAQRISLGEQRAMHVNLKATLDSTGMYLSVSVSEWFISESTVASFSNGKEVPLWH